jgi:hypothetical protein
MRGVTVPVPIVAQAARATSGATQQTTAAINSQTAATKANVTAKQQQALTDRQAAAEAARLARANQLVAAAQRQLVAVEEAGKATTTELAKARAQLRAANNAVLAGQRAVTASEVKGAEAASAQAAATLQDAEALVVEAKAAESAAIAQAKLDAATAASTRKQEQFRRGIEASGLSVFGFRAATLAASSSFLIGATAVEVLRKSVEAATHEAEAAAQAQQVFGDSFGEVESKAQSFANTIGVSTTQALKFETAFANVLQNAGFARNEIPGLSEEFLKLGADMAAARNVPLDKTLQALQLAVVGNSRGLRAFGIELNAAAVNEEALTETGKQKVTQLTREEKIQARLNLIRAQTANFEGAAERRAHSLAGETRRLQANLENLAAAIGTVAIPALSSLAEEINKSLSPILQLIKFTKEHSSVTKDGETHATLFGQALHFLGEAEKRAAFPTLTLIDGYNLLKKTWEDGDKQAKQSGGILDAIFGPSLARFGLTVKDALNPVNQMVFGLQQLTNELLKTARAAADLSFDQATKSLARFQDQQNQAIIARGGKEDLGADLANLQKQQGALEQQVAAAQAAFGLKRGAGGEDTALKRLRQARADLAENLQQQVQIRQQIASDAAKAAQDILDAVQKAQDIAQKAIDAANQALQDTLDAIARSLDIKQMRVEATTSLQDDLAFQRDVQKNIRAQIAVVKSMIISETERAARLHDLNVKMVASQLEQKRLAHEIAINRQQRRQQQFDRKAESIDLDIDLAQTNKNVRAEIAARRRRIALDLAREKQVKGDIIATKKLRNDIAEQRAAIKELEKELKKRNEAEQQLEFAFLQRQTGFVSNLLSNLLPTSAAAGTVSTTGVPARSVAPSVTPSVSGGGGGVSPTGPSGGGGGTVIDTDPGGITKTAQSKATGGGPTTGQMNALIHVERQILHTLLRLVGQRTHPEAVITRAAQSVSMDFFG